MKGSLRAAVASLYVLGLSVLAVARAPAAELRILAGESLAVSLEKLAGPFERTSGDRLVLRFGTTPQLIKLIRGSTSFDLIIVPSDVLKDRAVRARLTSGPGITVARAGLAVAVRTGSPKPDISTARALRKTLLQARSIATIPASAAGARILQVLKMLGIDAAVKMKIRAQSTPSQVVQAVASGRVQLAVFLSNVLEAPGLDMVGAFPDGLQREVVFTAKVAGDASRSQLRAAQAFVHYLQSPAAKIVLKTNGMTSG